MRVSLIKERLVNASSVIDLSAMSLREGQSSSSSSIVFNDVENRNAYRENEHNHLKIR